MVHKGIATLAAGLMFCFFLLSHFDQEFFFLHLYQSLIYLAIILMLFYFEDRYAYMLGILAPAVWLVLISATGLAAGAMRQLILLFQMQAPTNYVSLLAAFMVVLALLMIAFCAYRWKREFAGLGKARRTLLVSLGILVVYYGLLVTWFWRGIPQASALG